MSTYKKKLIEVALPLATISEESFNQKSMGQAPHPQGVHRWWARRPLAATRAVLWASLVDDPSAHPDKFPTEEDQAQERRRLFDILERLVPWEASNDEAILEEARAEIIASCDGELPNVLDPFAGGGAIPLESLRLGLPTFAGDLNPVAVLIQRAMLEIPHRFANQPPINPDARNQLKTWKGAEGLAADVQYYGEWMRERAFEEIGHLYPDVVLDDGTKATPIAWIWARTVQSPDPAWPGHVPIVRSWVLSKKPKKPVVWIQPIIDHGAKAIRYEVHTGGSPQDGNVGRAGATCIASGSTISLDYIRTEAQAGRMGEQLLAVIAESDSGRHFLAAPKAHDLAAEAYTDMRDDELEDLAGKIFDWPGRTNVVRYGMDAWWKLFRRRQLAALLTFSDLIPEMKDRVRADHAATDDTRQLFDGGNGAVAYADAVATFLAFVIDKCADFWSTVVTWNSTNAQTTATFAKQALPMTWDFTEVNPFSMKMSSWDALLRNETRSIPTLATRSRAHVAQRDAEARIRDVGTSMVCTDPPYYDNICYADLSDFFYVWLRRNLRGTWPNEFATLATPKAEELIANRYRAGSKEAAERHFEEGIATVFAEAQARADGRFPATIFYAFKAAESNDGATSSTGWETFLSGLIRSGWRVVATWPIRTERTIGIKGHSAMLASSVVLVCRPRMDGAAMATRGEFITALKTELPPAIKLLQAENIAPVDMAQSAIGPGIGVFSRCARVVEADGSDMTVRTALALINEVLSEVLSGDEAELDGESRFAVTWFEQYGQNPGPVGDAITLATAKNTSVDGVVDAGIAASRDGKFRILERSELDPDWNPQTDTRLTVWETTQHLIHRLEHSETDAAALLTQVGPGYAERARQLAYLLYGICDRKKWAEEAAAYNTLVTAWPELSRLAVAGDGPGQGQLI